MSLEQIQAEVSKIGQAVVALQAGTEERIKALESNKGAAEVDAKLEKINASINEHKDRLDQTEEGIKVRLAKAEEAYNARQDVVEQKLNQLHAGAIASGDEHKGLRQNAAKFYALRNNGEAPEHVDVEQYQKYTKAFSHYLKKGIVHNEMSVGQDSEGGYLVPTEMSTETIKKLFLTSPIRSVAGVTTISTDSIEFPVDNTRASAGWVSEKGSRPATDTPTVGKKRIEVHEMYAEPEVTQKFLDDAAIDVEAWLAEKVSMEFAFTENTAFVTGNGVGKPRGFLDYGAASVTTDDATRNWSLLQYVPTGASGAFDTISGLVADDANPFINIIAKTASGPASRGGVDDEPHHGGCSARSARCAGPLAVGAVDDGRATLQPLRLSGRGSGRHARHCGELLLDCLWQFQGRLSHCGSHRHSHVAGPPDKQAFYPVLQHLKGWRGYHQYAGDQIAEICGKLINQ